MNSNSNEKTTVVVQVFNDFVEANFCKNKLMENGIESFLLDENVIGLNPLGGIELKVFEEDVDQAREILSSNEEV